SRAMPARSRATRGRASLARSHNFLPIIGAETARPATAAGANVPINRRRTVFPFLLPLQRTGTGTGNSIKKHGQITIRKRAPAHRGIPNEQPIAWSDPQLATRAV